MGDQLNFEELEKTLDDFSNDKSQAIQGLKDKYRPLLNKFSTEKLVGISNERENYTDSDSWVFPSIFVYLSEIGIVSFLAPIPTLVFLQVVAPTLTVALAPVTITTFYLLHRRKRKRVENELISEFVSTFGEETYKERFHGKVGELVDFYTSLPIYKNII